MTILTIMVNARIASVHVPGRFCACCSSAIPADSGAGERAKPIHEDARSIFGTL
jgi:predicted nucleic acid-binding Zn ribbon protein